MVVNHMWIFKVKCDTTGDVSRFKARFVAKGCSQRAGLDYTETFSPAIRMASLRLFMAIAAARDLELGQLDIDTAFLYAHFKEELYIRQSLGFNDSTSKVCHLKRCCLYGLTQSPRESNTILRAWLVDHGWQQCVSDPCIYIFSTGHVFAMIAMYVDDIPAACSDATWLTSFKAQLGARFKIKDLGDHSYSACTSPAIARLAPSRWTNASTCATSSPSTAWPTLSLRPSLWTPASSPASRT
jgi:hypothetical protein